ncbi:hypothetical protein AVEN_194046-1 [Araneus ventricosus]|uniref:Uncharacterized protein n=1 Tax=Araneus ventricosus TaxID=182803 RepID=A0A4Y2DL01_ARAVE|nr:hypothetical protein AVEN_194046-1 [Araneus ventricosus]
MSDHLKLRSYSLSFHEFRPRYVLFPIVGTERIAVARGLVSASVASRVMAVNSLHVKGGGSDQTASVHPFTRALPRDLPRLVGIPPTTVHKCEPRATRGFTKPHAMGTRLEVQRYSAALTVILSN